MFIDAVQAVTAAGGTPFLEPQAPVIVVRKKIWWTKSNIIKVSAGVGTALLLILLCCGCCHITYRSRKDGRTGSLTKDLSQRFMPTRQNQARAPKVCTVAPLLLLVCRSHMDDN
jgi:hypothetical protein